jgi:hypothetical protein
LLKTFYDGILTINQTLNSQIYKIEVLAKATSDLIVDIENHTTQVLVKREEIEKVSVLYFNFQPIL